MISHSSNLDVPRCIVLSDGEIVPAPNPVTVIQVPDEGKFVRVLHDWEHNEWDWKARVAISHSTPETCPLWAQDGGPDFHQMNSQYQTLWFDLIMWASHGTMTTSQLKTAWANITAERKALTDKHGRGHFYTDYILDMYLNSSRNMFQKDLVFGGSLLKVVSTGWKYHQIECVNMNDVTPSLEHVIDRPWMYGWLTEINGTKLPDGTYPVSRWPDLEKFGGWGVPYMVIGKTDKTRVEKRRTVEVENGSTYPIYN